MKHSLFLVMLVLWTGAAVASPWCENMSSDLRPVLTAEPNWTVVDVEDLVDDDQTIWRSQYAGLCPGIAVLDLRGDGTKSYAIALLMRKDKVRVDQKVIVATRKGERFLSHTLISETNVKHTDVAAPFVVRKARPGSYRDIVRESKITIRHDGIIYEKIEATATLYFLKSGRFRSILLSE